MLVLQIPIKNARVAQLVERDLAKVEAAGSSPVSRSFKKCGNADKHSVSVFLAFSKNSLHFCQIML